MTQLLDSSLIWFGSPIHGIFPGKNTGKVCHFLLQESSWPKNWTTVSCIGRRVVYHWATGKAFLEHMSWQMILWHSTVSCEKFLELWSPSPGIQGPCSWGLFWGSSVASSLSHGSGQNPFSCLLHSTLLCPLSCGCSSCTCFATRAAPLTAEWEKRKNLLSDCCKPYLCVVLGIKWFDPTSYRFSDDPSCLWTFLWKFAVLLNFGCTFPWAKLESDTSIIHWGLHLE